MLAVAMPTRRAPTKRQPPPSPARKGQFNVRLDDATHDGLLEWLAELNRGRRIPLTQSELVRASLEWCLEHKPDVEKT